MCVCVCVGGGYVHVCAYSNLFGELCYMCACVGVGVHIGLCMFVCTVLYC